MKEQPKDKFTITVKKGHASVKIYRVKNREALYYCVSYVGPQGRQRRNFADLAVAKREANNSAQHLADGDMEAFKLRGREKQIYVEAARYYKKHVDVDLPQIMAADAVEKFRAAKEAEGMSAMYLKDIRGLLGDFARDFQCS